MIATTKEQSERILKCGIPADSADMHYIKGILSVGKLCWDKPFPKKLYPSWSLGRLIEFLPRELDDFECHYQYDFFSNDEPTITEGHYTLEGELVIRHSNTWIIDYDFYGFVGTMPQSKDPIEAVIRAIELLYANDYRFDDVK